MRGAYCAALYANLMEQGLGGLRPACWLSVYRCLYQEELWHLLQLWVHPGCRVHFLAGGRG